MVLLLMPSFELHHMDCRLAMSALMDANSIDSIVCDPPYELTSIVKRFGSTSAAPAKHGTDGAFARASRGFMGQTWDGSGVAFDPAMWAEAWRVLKPGGYLLAFSGSRTYHRMVCAIEDAGFEIRDQIMWIYGSGFPKSLDVSKAIVKTRVEDREPVRVVCRFIRAAMDSLEKTSTDLAVLFDCHSRMIDHWAARDTDSQPALPTDEQYELLKAVLGLSDEMDGEVRRLNARKGTHGARWANAEIIGEQVSAPPGFQDQRFNGDRTIRSLDDAARQWEGWGTALKPAHEPIVVARKPLLDAAARSCTVAQCVQTWGTGAINIDASRIGYDMADTNPATNPLHRKMAGYANGSASDAGSSSFTLKDGSGERNPNTGGRFPANVIHDGSPEVLAGFPSENGRFFYAPKASKSDRDEGLSHFAKQSAGMTGSGGAHLTRRDEGYQVEPRANIHPTVKPTDLMRYLIRMVTPAGGTVLDPFTGSGSTGKAAMLEGFNFIGCEMTDEYVPIAEARIRSAQLTAWLGVR